MTPGWAAGLIKGVPDRIDELATVEDTVVVTNTVTVGVAPPGAALVIGPRSGVCAGGVMVTVRPKPNSESALSRWPLAALTGELTVTVTVVVTGTIGLMTIVVTGCVVVRGVTRGGAFAEVLGGAVLDVVVSEVVLGADLGVVGVRRAVGGSAAPALVAPPLDSAPREVAAPGGRTPAPAVGHNGSC